MCPRLLLSELQTQASGETVLGDDEGLGFSAAGMIQCCTNCPLYG